MLLCVQGQNFCFFHLSWSIFVFVVILWININKWMLLVILSWNLWILWTCNLWTIQWIFFNGVNEILNFRNRIHFTVKVKNCWRHFVRKLYILGNCFFYFDNYCSFSTHQFRTNIHVLNEWTFIWISVCVQIYQHIFFSNTSVHSCSSHKPLQYNSQYPS